jgi:hypothetical protein
MILGGALTLLSAFLTWFDIDAGGLSFGNRSYKATDLMSTLGSGLIVLSVVLLVVGAMHAWRAPRGRGLAIIAIVVGTFVALTGLIPIAQAAVALGNFGKEEVAADFGISDEEDVADILEGAEADEIIDVKPAVGAIIALGGGVLALLGGALALTRARSRARNDVVEANDENRDATDSSA